MSPHIKMALGWSFSVALLKNHLYKRLALLYPESIYIERFIMTVLKKATALCFMWLLMGSALAYPYEYPVKEIATINDMEKIAVLQEDEIDIGWLALVFAKETHYPELDIERYNMLLDMMAIDIKVKMARIGQDDSDTRIRVMNTYFFKVLGFEYDKDDILGRKKSNRTINGLMDTEKGSCWTMPLLYLAVAQRLRYPIYPVSAPQHIFLRYDDPGLEMRNIEATTGGYSSDEEYIYVMQVPEAGIKSGAYMKILTYREFMGEMIAENGRHWAMNGDIRRGVRYLELAAKLQPTGAEIKASLASAYYDMAVANPDRYDFFLWKANNTMDRAEALGLPPMIDENYAEYQKTLQKGFWEKEDQK
jgi:regulator of sirC expression with transglutaminase-like and TPR domain